MPSLDGTSISKTDANKTLNKLAISDDIRPKRTGRRFWPSKLGLIEMCPASYTEPGEVKAVIDRTSDAAAIGRAVHKIAERIVSGEISEIDDDLIMSECIKLGVDSHFKDIVRLCENALEMWLGTDSREGLRTYFVNPSTEHYMSFEHVTTNPYTQIAEKVSLSGFFDVAESFSVEEGDSAVKNWAIVLDWKTGRKGDLSDDSFFVDIDGESLQQDDSDDSSEYLLSALEEASGLGSIYRGQMLSYAVMLMANDAKIQQVTTIICWVRDKRYSMATFTREEVREWFKNFLSRSAFWDGYTFSPGDHCLWCRRYYECPARAAMINSAVSSLVDGGAGSMVVGENGELVDPDKLYRAYKQADMLVAAVKKFKGDLKSEVIKRGFINVPSLGDGRGFGFTKRRGPSHFDNMQAWPILKRHLSDEDIAGIISIGKGKLQDAIKKNAPRGKKEESFRNVMDELNENGAITRGPDREVFGITEEDCFE